MKSRAIHAALLLAVLPLFGQVSQPWHHPDATRRTVYLITAPIPLRDAAVTLPAPPPDGTLAVVDAALPFAPLPLFAGTNGLTFVLPGALLPDRPRTVIAYQGGAAASPRLPEQPPLLCDYATNEIGYPWDFENGTPCGITGWGDRPSHLGPVSVERGWLRIPVKDIDPYFIWGNMFGSAPSPKDLHINSAHYRTLELRVRQSCAQAEWSIFLTDRDGQHKSMSFTVQGTEAQTRRFDLASAFPDFWDGREFRALRIDTTNDKRDILAEVDYVRILPAPPAVISGPCFTREALAAREAVLSHKPAFPDTLAAGAPGTLSVKTYDRNGDRLAPGRAVWTLLTEEHGTRFIEGAPEGKSAKLALPAFTRAGPCAWKLGLAGDLGQPLHTVSGTVKVVPGSLASLRLVPLKTHVALSAPEAHVSVQGLDACGNPVPVNIRKPRWTLPEGVRPPAARVRGNPARVTLTLPGGAASRHAIALADGQGHACETAVTTVAYRKERIALNPNGYLVTPAGALYFPNGGLYANWPHRLLPDGSIGQAVDLFPCGPSPYKEGFPWSARTEEAVAAYLKHCAERGVNCLRLMLRNMDLVGRVDPVQLQATLHLFDLARPYGIRFNVALFEDYDKPPYVSQTILEKIVLPHYTADQLADLPPHRARFLVRKEVLSSAALRYSDPDAIACQRDYLRELLPVLAAREEVLCYEFENEMVYPPMSWCASTAAFIRTIDPYTLILGNPGPHEWPEPLRWRESGCDLYSYHPYNDGQPQADHGAIIYLRSKWSAQSGLPMYTGEGGLNQNRWQREVKKVAPEAAARGTRDQIWMSVCCGANGCLYWTFMHDLEAQEYATVLPALQAVGVDLAALKRQRPAVALLQPPKRRAPQDAAVALRLLDLGVDFDTVATDEAGAYAVRLDPAAQPPESLTLPATVATPAKGWQAATLLDEAGRQALLYLRNVAGGVQDKGAPPRPCFLRDVQPAEAAFTLRAAWGRIVVYDLVTRQARTVTADAAGRVTLGVTDHDYLIGLRR